MLGTTVPAMAALRQVRREGPRGPFSVEIPDSGISFEALERSLLQQALSKGAGIVSRAARLLGMSRRTFQYRLQKFDLQRPAREDREAEAGAAGERSRDAGSLR